jgi:hypothetical protein
MTSRRRSSAYRKAQGLAKCPNPTPIDLAEALWQAEQEEPGSLKAICEDTGLGTRKAYYLLEIWERFSGLNIQKRLLVDVGWTKLALMAKHSAPGMEPTWLDLAQRHTVKELEAMLKEGPHEKLKAHSTLLRLSPSQYKVFATVLPKFGAKPPRRGKGLMNKEQALTRALRQIS